MFFQSVAVCAIITRIFPFVYISMFTIFTRCKINHFQTLFRSVVIVRSPVSVYVSTAIKPKSFNRFFAFFMPALNAASAWLSVSDTGDVTGFPWLQNNESAGNAFFGENAEIMRNELYRDQKAN